MLVRGASCDSAPQEQKHPQMAAAPAFCFSYAWCLYLADWVSSWQTMPGLLGTIWLLGLLSGLLVRDFVARPSCSVPLLASWLTPSLCHLQLPRKLPQNIPVVAFSWQQALLSTTTWRRFFVAWHGFLVIRYSLLARVHVGQHGVLGWPTVPRGPQRGGRGIRSTPACFCAAYTKCTFGCMGASLGACQPECPHADLALFALCREIWYKITCPGTFRSFARAVLALLCGKGWTFDFPTATESDVHAAEGTPCAAEAAPVASDSWCVGDGNHDSGTHGTCIHGCQWARRLLGCVTVTPVPCLGYSRAIMYASAHMHALSHTHTHNPNTAGM